MKPILLCLDSGTTSVKAAAFDRHGRIVAMAQRDNHALRRDGIHVEQDMDISRDDAFAVLKECAAKVSGRIEGLMVTGQGDGLWPLDVDARPVGRAITWLDGRARELAAELQRDGAFEPIEAVTYSRPTAASQSLHLLWLKQNDPARLGRIAYVLRCKEWLFFSLTGRLLGEPSAALPVWGDWRTGEVSRVVQEALGLSRGVELLPEFVPVGQCRAALSDEAASALGLPAGIPVLLGPGDVQATLIGLGLGARAGVTRASVFGTSAIHACHMEDPLLMREKPAGAMVQKFVLGSGYLCFHPSFNGATLFSHVARMTGQEPARSEPRYSNVVLHPFFEPGGERAPYTSPHASGAMFGVTALTEAGEIAWAAREALAFIARKSHEMMNAPSGDLALGGGLAGDGHFAAFLAAALGATVQRTTSGHAGLRGLGAIGAKSIHGASDADLERDWIGEPEEAVAPGSPAVTDYAAAKYALFSQLLDEASHHWDALADVGARASNITKGEAA